MNGSSAIVIGASIAGLVTARVLSDHVDRVMILERDHLPDEAVPRRGVPQGRHAHVLLAAGQTLLTGWFPGLTDDLVAQGAVPFDAGDVLVYQGGGYLARHRLGHLAISMSRPLLENALRRRLLQQRSNVTLRDQLAVDTLLVEDDRVVGVLSDGVQHRADLVVACTGRNTRMLDHLAKSGFAVPEVSAIRIDMAYGTRVVTRRPDDLDRALALVIDDPTRGHRMGNMVPVEGGRWIVTLGSFHGENPPTEPDEFLQFARSLPAPALADVLGRAEPLSPVLTHRMPTSQRRHVERLRRVPAGFLVLGDAVCSFNPVYGQGMSSAALQARELDRTLRRHGFASPSLPRAFYRRAAKVVAMPWRMAAVADFADPGTTGPKPVGADLSLRGLDWAVRAGHASAVVARQMVRVYNLLARPRSLLHPAMAARVLLAARRSPARNRNHPPDPSPRRTGPPGTQSERPSGARPG
ncbi:FAD-dependent oxidoreductase [Mangrovihabitans endophyticus]|uniref:FAD-binding monooxygenase n=1 Tax=Mangrovihabitans endophyticus TaxID=1751298 RepID=A0A8J3FLF8_9ACTN|nr:FAD-dependent monooxygenase [Mangrovihabitans endophyticus]GGK76247.1 FAD-binding monooxygenase [Mangrovihabitans endophyticus]